MKFNSEHDIMINGQSGPDERPVPWDENHDTETLKMLNIADTCPLIYSDARKSLQKEREK